MKILLALIALPLAGLGLSVPQLATSPYADGETATNFPFEVRFAAMSRMEFTVALDASLTNVVEVSVGADADEDGDLSPEEAAYAVGFDGGRWFMRDAVSDSEETGDASGIGRIQRTFVLRRRQLDESWNLVKVVRRGEGRVCELTTVEGMRPGAVLIAR